MRNLLLRHQSARLVTPSKFVPGPLSASSALILDVPCWRPRRDLRSGGWNDDCSIKSSAISGIILTLFMQMSPPALAVTWPIERRYFDDGILDRRHDSKDTEKGWADPSTGTDFVFLPAGCFDMGDSTAGFLGEICVEGFFLSRHEITNAQFRHFRPTHDSGDHLGLTLDGDEQPAVNVSWQDAMAFATWLGNETDTSIRLATEAEWEYACGYGWGEDVTEHAGMFGNLRASEDDADAKVDGTVAVGSYKSGPNGIYDMHGNASEWVFDSYVDDVNRYGGNRNDPRIELETTPLRVRRGGSWSSSEVQSGCAARDYYLGDLAVPHTGFRLVAEPN